MHTIPWFIRDDGHFSDLAPITILDHFNAPICAVVAQEPDWSPAQDDTGPQTLALARRLAALPVLEAALREILAGSAPQGRWLDAEGSECPEDAEGAEFHSYDAHENRAWLDTVADLARAAIAATTPEA